jgi:UDP-N-acetylglucosamine 3-dehydrogenase
MVKIGLVGVGKWGLNHLRSISELDCDFVGFSDVDVGKKKLAGEYGVDFFSSYKSLLSMVDAVVVTTPTDTHYDVVMGCLNAGKHVFVEKPIASSSSESKELVDLARSKNLVLSVGYLYRFNNSVKCVKELIKEIGEIHYIGCRYVHSTKPPRKDSGVVFNLGIHLVDVLSFVFDEKPSSVFARKRNLLSEEFEDSAVVLLDYSDFFAVMELSCVHPEKKRDMWIVAEKEKLYVDFFDQRIVRYPLTVNYERVDRGESFEETLEKNEPLKDELKYFVDFVGSGDFDLDNNMGREEYYTTRICELCLESAEKGKELVVE